MRKCLVTGGCGFIGSTLVHMLQNKGWIVDVVDDLSNGKLDNLQKLSNRIVMPEMLPFYRQYYERDRKGADVLIITGDFVAPNVLERVSSGTYDVIFHLAALPRVAYSIAEPVFTTETNILKTVALFNAAAGKVSRVVFSSSSSVYGNAECYPTSEDFLPEPRSPYALQKVTAEKYATQFAEFYGLDIVSLRYFNVYGPRQRGADAYSTVIAAWCEAISSEVALRKDGTGEQSRDFTYVDDVARANMMAADFTGRFKGETINIANGTSISINEVLNMFYDRFGHLRILEAPARPGDVFKTQGDGARAKEMLGYEPSVSLPDGLAKTWRWWDYEG